MFVLQLDNHAQQFDNHAQLMEKLSILEKQNVSLRAVRDRITMSQTSFDDYMERFKELDDYVRDTLNRPNSSS